jgi:hypothetical protein
VNVKKLAGKVVILYKSKVLLLPEREQINLLAVNTGYICLEKPTLSLITWYNKGKRVK